MLYILISYFFIPFVFFIFIPFFIYMRTYDPFSEHNTARLVAIIIATITAMIIHYSTEIDENRYLSLFKPYLENPYNFSIINYTTKNIPPNLKPMFADDGMVSNGEYFVYTLTLKLKTNSPTLEFTNSKEKLEQREANKQLALQIIKDSTPAPVTHKPKEEPIKQEISTIKEPTITSTHQPMKPIFNTNEHTYHVDQLKHQFGLLD